MRLNLSLAGLKTNFLRFNMPKGLNKCVLGLSFDILIIISILGGGILKYS